MLDAVRRYATRVLLLHFVLFAVVVGVVLFAARAVYRSERGLAIKQSGERLDLLAQQTSRGIGDYYLSVMSDLNALLRDESETPATMAVEPRLAETRPEGPIGGGRGFAGAGGQRGGANGRQGGGLGFGGGGLGGRLNFRQIGEGRTVPASPQLTGIMWRQLRGRVSSLFLVDNDTGRVLAAFPDSASAFAREVTKEHLDWFKSLKESSMSLRQPAAADGTGVQGGESGAYHLIAIPALGTPVVVARPGGGPGQGPGPGPGQGAPGGPPPEANAGGGGGSRTVVAVVPIEIVKEKFFDPLNDQHVVNAALLDDSGTVLVSIDPAFVGTNVLEEIEPSVRAGMAEYIVEGKSGVDVQETPYRLGKEEISPRIIAFEQIEGLPGRRWTVLASAPLSDAEGLVNNVLGEALAWAVFVSLSVSAILVSTSFFMIRTRVRFERARHKVLTKELEQARQIQLAWLPDLKNVPEGLEMSAANLPASHISGDFYNWFRLPAQHAAGEKGGEHEVLESSKIGIVIGDVTGHGMAAAFLMATTQLIVRTTLSRFHDPGRCLGEVNRQLCLQGFQGQFVTMLVIVLDPETSSIEIATAGHPAPLVEREGEFVPLVMEPHLVLGVDPAEKYETEGFILEAGASVMLYTDGVVEAQSESGEQYGVGRLMEVLRKVSGEGESGREPQRRIAGVLEDVKRFCGKRELLDDVTIVAVRTVAAAVEVSGRMVV